MIEIVYNMECNTIENNDNTLVKEGIQKRLFFDTDEFHKYHKKFAERVYKVILKKKGKVIGECCLGVRQQALIAPYSSPFSMIYPQIKWKNSEICNIIGCLKEIAKYLECKSIMFTLPPDIYNKEVINATATAFFHNNFYVKHIDINNYFNLDDFIDLEHFVKNLVHSSRKNYRRAIESNLQFEEMPLYNFDLVYKIIKINREEMGYPLKMSLEHMKDIISMKESDCRCFCIKLYDNYIAAAIIFDINEYTSQVIYWGDIREYSNMRPMGLLPIKLVEYYKNLGKKYLDIGPSSENGIINEGLADFKKSVGCRNNLKLCFKYDL